ncbi:hypothetical protein CSA37_09170 [Candidatus Fermentibacteria bacterium]|nr:MAG: hypothetical protein CSA37_09170 [Candidatus Fermentibacteria bacterium]
MNEHSARPVRLVMINAGKFDYGEIDLSLPVHLVGQNNVGKTTLISTLQFLYIDNQKQMHFSRPMDETRRYYFPGAESYILFECLTPAGYMVTGARGLGPLKRYEFERFLYRGSYDRNDYIDSDTNEVLDFQNRIAPALSSRDYASLTPSELMEALTSVGRGKTPFLGLVPVKNRTDYGKFRKIFRNLLHLAHLSQEELKKFLIDVNSSELKRTEIDLTTDFSEKHRLVKKSACTLADLKASAENANQILQLDDNRRGVQKELPCLYSAALHALKREREAAISEIESHGKALAELKQKETALRDNLNRNTRREGELHEKAGALKSSLKEFRELKKITDGYMEDLEAGAINSLDHRLTQVQVALRDASRANEGRTRERQLRAEERLEQLENRMKHIGSLAVLALKNASPRTLSVLRLFNEKILELPEGPGGIETAGREELINNLEQLGSCIDDEKELFRKSFIAIDLKRVPKPDLKKLTDLDALREEIAAQKEQIQTDGEVIEAIQKKKSLENERKALKEQLEDKRRRRDNWLRYCETEVKACQWQNDLDKVERDLEETAAEKEKNSRELEDLEEKGRQHQRMRDAAETTLNMLTRVTGELPGPEPGWKQDPLVSEGDDALILVNNFRKKYEERNRLSQRIADRLAILERATYAEYKAADETAALVRLRQDMDAIGEKEEALRKLWSGLASDVSQSMKSLLKSLDTLRRRVNSLNNRLSKVSVSDLKQLKLVLNENSRITGLVKQGMEADTMPLFADREQVERSLESLGKLLETAGGRIELKDMFSLSFEILDSTGRTRKFTRLENIESNGTTITIKVLVNLMLLKDLLPENRARIPFYLDEASSLDRDNLASVVDMAFEMGFPAILASPDPMDVASRIYFMKDTGGRVYLDPDLSCIEVERHRQNV